MPKGYAEGPAAEEAERRLDELERGGPPEDGVTLRPAVFGSSEDDLEPHFLGWVGEVDADQLFASGAAWGLTVRRIRRG